MTTAAPADTKSTTVARGAIIVFEGGDRCGKSTQVTKLHEALVKQGRRVEIVKFPDRTTPIGKLIDGALRKETTMPLQALRLLFAANRWELAESMIRKVRQGTTLILDRYSYSGIAYAIATRADSETALASNDQLIVPELGLPAPDCVFWIATRVKDLETRKQFGAEAFETKEIQLRVFDAFAAMGNAKWHRIEGGQSIDNIHKEIMNRVETLLLNIGSNPMERMKKSEFFL